MHETIKRAVCEAVTLEELRDIFQWAASVGPRAVISARSTLANRRHRLGLLMPLERWTVCREPATGRTMRWDTETETYTISKEG